MQHQKKYEILPIKRKNYAKLQGFDFYSIFLKTK